MASNMVIEEEEKVSEISIKFEKSKKNRRDGYVCEAIKGFKEIIDADIQKIITENDTNNDNINDINDIRLIELSIYGLAECYAFDNKAENIQTLLISCRPFLENLPKARIAKLVKTLIDLLSSLPDTNNLLVILCQDCIQWCINEKRTFLRHRIESRLATLYQEEGKLTEGFELVYKLLNEVKKLEDKLLLVEIHLIETKLFWQIRNIPKSKAALTSARTNANAIHCPPLLQGDIDLQGGIIHSYEKDFKTAYSYFFEAFEAFSSAVPINTSLQAILPKERLFPKKFTDAKALKSLKYLILSQIMGGRVDDINLILTSKYALQFITNEEIVFLKEIATCHKQRSLKEFQISINKHQHILDKDKILSHHIQSLYDTLMENNILRILEPFSKIEIPHVANLIDLPLKTVQSKLEHMTLDGKLHGTLDQGNDVLILFNNTQKSEVYDDVLGTFRNMSDVLEALHIKAHQIG